MRRPLLLTSLTVAALAAAAPRAMAQAAAGRAPEPERVPGRGEWSVGGWVGGAPTSYAGHFIGATPGRAIALAGVRVGVATGMVGPVALEYVAQLIPAAVAYDNPVAPLSNACGFLTTAEDLRRPGRQPVQVLEPGYCRRRVFGAGALPLGLQLTAPLGRAVRVFAAGNAGALVFAENMPVPSARRFNFAFDFGGGFEVGTRRSGAVTLGYKLHHISNAWTARSNPGIDHHVLYLGFVHRVRSGRATARPNEPTAAGAGGAGGAGAPGDAKRGGSSR
jgi:hypothetical protein